MLISEEDGTRSIDLESLRIDACMACRLDDDA